MKNWREAEVIESENYFGPEHSARLAAFTMARAEAKEDAKNEVDAQTAEAISFLIRVISKAEAAKDEDEIQEAKEDAIFASAEFVV